MAPREAEVAVENIPMDSLPLVVQPPSQEKKVSVVEAAGTSSVPILGVKVGVNPSKQWFTQKRRPTSWRLPYEVQESLGRKNCSSSNIIMSVYIIPFHFKPWLTRHPLIILGYKDQHKDLALVLCICSLLNKQAIELVQNIKSLVY